MSGSLATKSIRFVPDLYPRLKPSDDVVERYRDALDRLPPITVARGGIIVDGYHRWQAHVREGVETIAVDDLGNLSDAEIVRESISRNASHGHQLSRADKRRLAAQLWSRFADMDGNRTTEIATLLAVSERSVSEWTKDARKEERDAQQARAFDLWLECWTQQAIADETGMSQQTVSDWVTENRKSADFGKPPASRQHFDLWQFKMNSRDAGQQSYFGALAPQVMENLLWFYTEPGDTVVDLFAGSGTTIEVAKRMGRRVWASDIKGDEYAPYLPIHQADATRGWPEDAPAKPDLVFLDPPYWKQAAGRYSDSGADLANMDLDGFMDAWKAVVGHCVAHLPDSGRLAFIISPTQLKDDTVIDHATAMTAACADAGLTTERRIVVPYQTQQATGQQVEWARENRRMLKLYRDLVVMRRE